MKLLFILNSIGLFGQSICGWSGGVKEDTADTISGDFEGHSDVASFSPVGGPGVPDDQVLGSALYAVADGGDCVVEIVTTGSGVEDSAFVRLEGGTTSID